MEDRHVYVYEHLRNVTTLKRCPQFSEVTYYKHNTKRAAAMQPLARTGTADVRTTTPCRARKAHARSQAQRSSAHVQEEEPTLSTDVATVFLAETDRGGQQDASAARPSHRDRVPSLARGGGQYVGDCIIDTRFYNLTFDCG